MLSDLKALRDIISSSIDTLTEAYEAAGIDCPSLDQPFQHDGHESAGGVRKQPDVAESISKIVAGCAQLVAIIQDPHQSLLNFAYSYYFSAALGVVEAGNIAEILREAGVNGLHIEELAAKSGMHEKKLGVVMIYLVTRHVFREVSPYVFANNMISSLLDSGKPVDAKLSAETKIESAQGMNAEVGFNTNEGMKCASYLIDAMTDPEAKYSEELNGGAYQLGLKTKLGLFDWLGEPENAVRRKMFAKIMAGSVVTQPPTSVLKAFDWDSLKPGSLIADIGGGLGHVSLEIARAYPKLQVVLEDTPHNARDALVFWKQRLPDAVSEGRVQFAGSSFFDPQPRFSKPVDVFLLRYVLHDWSDKYAIKILRNLRDAASAETKLVVIDTIMAHACGSDEKDKNPFVKLPPKPLLQNWGEANMLVYSVDIAVLALLNAGERTKEGFEDIFAASGWKLREIRWESSDPNLRPSIIAEPV